MNPKSKGVIVAVKDGENMNQALRRFKRKVEESNKLETLRKKEFYEKPTTARKRAAGAAKARYRKKLEKEAIALKTLRQNKK
jgi:small subunit ribosomal protein S21